LSHARFIIPIGLDCNIVFLLETVLKSKQIVMSRTSAESINIKSLLVLHVNC